MTTWDDLPRDLHLRVAKNMDMDTRIKAGIVTRLRVPAPLKAKLSAVLGRIVHGRTKYRYGSCESSSTEVGLGSRNRFPWAPNFMSPIYVLRYSPAARRFAPGWRVLHYFDDKLCSYAWDPASNGWFLKITT